MKYSFLMLSDVMLRLHTANAIGAAQVQAKIHIEVFSGLLVFFIAQLVGIASCNYLRLLQRGQIIQLERRGFYICNKPYVRASEPVELIFVPDGKNMFGIKR